MNEGRSRPDVGTSGHAQIAENDGRCIVTLSAGLQTSETALRDNNLTIGLFEGHSRVFTVSVVTLASISLVMIYSEHNIFQTSKLNIFVLDLVFNFALLIVFAVLDGLVAYGILLPNFRALGSSRYKTYVALSSACLVLADAMIAYIPFRLRDKSEGDIGFMGNGLLVKEAQFMLWGSTWLVAIITNIAYFHEIFRPYKEHIKENKMLPHMATRMRLQRDPRNKHGQLASKAEREVNLQKAMDAVMVKLIVLIAWLYEALLYKPVLLVFYVVNGSRKLIGRTWRGGKDMLSRAWLCSKTGRAMNEFNGRVRVAPLDAPIVIRSWQVVLLSLDRMKSDVHAASTSVRFHFNEFFNTIKEDEEFKHSSWMKGAVITSAIVLLYSALRCVGLFQYFITNTYEPKRRSLVDDDPDVRGQVSGLLNIVGFDVDEDDIQSSIDNFLVSMSGHFVIYLDALVRHAKWAMFVGYGVGTILGVLSLISVLAQYKRLILSLSRNVLSRDIQARASTRAMRRASLARIQSLQLHMSSWRSLIKIYPLGWTVYFFGILVSTTFLQMQVFGLFMTWMLATIASVTTASALFVRVGRVLLAFVLVWLVNHVLSRRLLANKLLTKGYRIKHPNVWVLYTIVYMIVHIITGVLYAIQRFLMLIFSAFLAISQLDKNVMRGSSLPFEDAGHKAFMSMVLMHHVIKENSNNPNMDNMESSSDESNDEENEESRYGNGNTGGVLNQASGDFTFDVPMHETSQGSLQLITGRSKNSMRRARSELLVRNRSCSPEHTAHSQSKSQLVLTGPSLVLNAEHSGGGGSSLVLNAEHSKEGGESPQKGECSGVHYEDEISQTGLSPVISADYWIDGTLPDNQVNVVSHANGYSESTNMGTVLNAEHYLHGELTGGGGENSKDRMDNGFNGKNAVHYTNGDSNHGNTSAVVNAEHRADGIAPND